MNHQFFRVYGNLPILFILFIPIIYILLLYITIVLYARNNREIVAQKTFAKSFESFFGMNGVNILKSLKNSVHTGFRYEHPYFINKLA